MFSECFLPEKARQSLGRPKDGLKREAILSAAAKLFLDRGYELTSMEAVAKAADVSKLTIYSHFENKAALFKQVIRQRGDQQAAPDNFFSFAQLPVKQGLQKIGKMMFTLIFNPDSLRLLRIIQTEALHHPQIVQIFYEAGPQRIKTAFAELLQEWDRQGQIAVADVDRATEQFFSLLKGEAHVKALMYLEPKLTDLEIDEHVRATVRLFLAGYGGKI